MFQREAAEQKSLIEVPVNPVVHTWELINEEVEIASSDTISKEDCLPKQNNPTADLATSLLFQQTSEAEDKEEEKVEKELRSECEDQNAMRLAKEIEERKRLIELEEERYVLISSCRGIETSFDEGLHRTPSMLLHV